MKGKVKWFNEAKGFGFIEGEDNEDYFVHVSQTDEKLVQDLEVEFETEKTDRGMQAKKVHVIN